MADEVSIRIEGGKELIDKLRSFTGGRLNLSSSLGESGRYLARFFSGEAFASRGGVYGRPWPRLTDSYARWKAEFWPGRPPLVQSGEMMRSFQYRESAQNLELWNGSDHFEFHQEGTPHIPQRLMMRLDQQRATRVGSFIGDDLDSQLRKARLI